jgi:hypothetical protein
MPTSQVFYRVVAQEAEHLKALIYLVTAKGTFAIRRKNLGFGIYTAVDYALRVLGFIR